MVWRLIYPCFGINNLKIITFKNLGEFFITAIAKNFASQIWRAFENKNDAASLDVIHLTIPH